MEKIFSFVFLFFVFCLYVEADAEKMCFLTTSTVNLNLKIDNATSYLPDLTNGKTIDHMKCITFYHKSTSAWCNRPVPLKINFSHGANSEQFIIYDVVKTHTGVSGDCIDDGYKYQIADSSCNQGYCDLNNDVARKFLSKHNLFAAASSYNNFEQDTLYVFDTQLGNDNIIQPIGG